MNRGLGMSGPLTGRLAVGALIGATVWMSQGVIALVDISRVTRVGALPGWPWLAVAVVTGAAMMAAVRPSVSAWPPLVSLTLLWLPWLPGRIPGALLMWDGPLEAVVWLGVAVGVLWLSRDRLWPRPWPSVSVARAPVLAGLLSALVFAGSWAMVRGRLPSGDEPHYLVITQSLVTDGDLRIENNHRDQQYLAYVDRALAPDFLQRGLDGEIYSIHAPGTAAAVAPGFLVAGYSGAVCVVIVLTALGMALVWQAAWLLSGSPQSAWVAWLAATTSAPVTLHAFTIFPDPLGGAAAMVGVLALVQLEVSQALAYRGWRWLGTGAALAALPWLHTRFAVVAGVLGVALIVRLLRRTGGAGDIARLLAVPAVAAAGWFTYFWRIYGTLNPAAPYGSRPDGGLAFVSTGLTGLFADQQFGIGPNAPVLLAAVVALVMLARHRPRLAGELLLTVLSCLIVAASYPMWWGGESAPARFAVAVLPLQAVPLAWAWSVAGPAGRAVIGSLLAVSVAVTAALVGVDHGAFMRNDRDGYSLLLDWLSRTVDLTLALPSVHRDGADTALADVVVWVAAGTFVGAIATLCARLARPMAARCVLWSAVPAGVMLATTVSWAGRDREVLTPSTSQARFLEHWDPAAAPVTAQLSPVRLLVAAEVPRRLNLGTNNRGPARSADGPLFQMPAVPAGDYDLLVEGRPQLSGAVVVRLGRQDVPMETWTLEGHSAGFTGLVLRLPVDAHSITVSGDEAARAAIRRLTLKPRVLVPRDRSLTARRAGRYGGVVVFALDDNADLEPGAQWVRGESAASFVVQADAGVRPVARVRAGPVDTVVTLSAGTWRADLPIAKEQSVDVALPDEALAPAVLSIASAQGFRPSEHTVGNEDVRFLGVYVTWPDPPAATVSQR